MQNLLILFNPYYQKDVVDTHITILKDKGAAGFGKIKSPLSSLSAQKELDWESLSSVSPASPLQLFLTDYSSLFVAKVTKVSQEIDPSLTPSYYQEKDLNVEAWFVIEDIIELVHKDFEKIRDLFLSNFTTPDYGNYTYAIYGNSYRYPLKVEMKNEIDYFLGDELFIPIFTNLKNFYLSKTICFPMFLEKQDTDCILRAWRIWFLQKWSLRKTKRTNFMISAEWR